MDVDVILKDLERLGNPANVEGMRRFGIGAPKVYGVAMPELRRIARSIGKDHRLAQQLWNSGFHEARIVASLVADPLKVTERQMERWAKEFDNWAVCDACCSNLFDKTDLAYRKAVEWTSRSEEFVKRAGFTLMAALAVHDKKAPDSAFLTFLPFLQRESVDERNFVRKAVNWALRQIGKRNPDLNRAAIRSAEVIRMLVQPGRPHHNLRLRPLLIGCAATLSWLKERTMFSYHHRYTNLKAYGRILSFSVFVWLLSSGEIRAAAPRLDNVLYGASYYYEYMPVERLEQDAELMEKAGLSFVRMGDSIWPGIEPREGEFEFAWFDRVVDRLHKAGIKIVLITPTYSIPPWLYKKYPEVLAVRLDGKKNAYGMRQNMDITNPTYLFYCERVIRQLVSRYKDHPAVIGFQLDNETSAYGTAGPNVQVGFVNYLKKKFKTTQELNRLWGLAYWGQSINDWDEFPSREGTINPGYKLEWERYQQKLCTDFLAWQAAIVNQVKRSDQFVTHDFAWPALPNVNAWEAAKALDIVAANCYYDVQDEFTGEANAYVGDYFRSVRQANYLLTETNAQTIGWDSKGQFPPYDGQLRLGVYGHLSSGANLVAYWHWHSIHYGQEMFWKGILGHDFEPGRVYEQVNAIAHELKQVGPRLVNLKKVNKVAILYSSDSYNAIQFMPFSDKIDYQTIMRQFHRTLYNLNVGVDFVFPENPDFSNYDVILVPPLYIASDALLEKLAEFVQRGGHLILCFKSGFCNEYSTIRWVRMPGSLTKACGFTYQEFSNLKQELPLKGDPFQVGDKNRVSSWAEFLVLDTAESMAFYDHPFFGKFPAITRNRYGQGTLTYEGTVLSDELQKKVLLDVLKRANLTSPDQNTPASVRVKHGIGNSGKKIHYYLNYSGQTQTLHYPYADAVNLLTNKMVVQTQDMNLGPWDLMILEER